MSISAECRREAHEAIRTEAAIRRKQILAILGKESLTAREIIQRMEQAAPGAKYDMNYVRPRLTEAVKLGEVEVVEKRRCPVTGRLVGVYRQIKQEGEKA